MQMVSDMPNRSDQQVDEQELENASLEDEDLEKVTGGVVPPRQVMVAKHEMLKTLAANLRV